MKKKILFSTIITFMSIFFNFNNIFALTCDYSMEFNGDFEDSEYYQLVQEGVYSKIDGYDEQKLNLESNLASLATVFKYTASGDNYLSYKKIDKIGTDFKLLLSLDTEKNDPITFQVRIDYKNDDGWYDSNKKYEFVSDMYGIDISDSEIRQLWELQECPSMLITRINYSETRYSTLKYSGYFGGNISVNDALNSFDPNSYIINSKIPIVFFRDYNYNIYNGGMCNTNNEYKKYLDVLSSNLIKKANDNNLDLKLIDNLLRTCGEDKKKCDNIKLSDELIKFPYSDRTSLGKDYDVFMSTYNALINTTPYKLGLMCVDYDLINDAKIMLELMKYLYDNNDLLNNINDVKKEQTLEDWIKNDIKNSCNGVPTNDYNDCMISACNKKIQSINCEKFYENYDENDEIMKEINRRIGEVQCTNDFCYNSQCSFYLEEVLNCNEIITGNTESRKKLEEKANDAIYELSEKFKFDMKDKNDICVIFDDEVKLFIRGILNIIRIIGPILVIFLTVYDAIKVIVSSKDDESKKMFNKFKIRLICIVLLLLIPTLCDFILSWIDKSYCSI